MTAVAFLPNSVAKCQRSEGGFAVLKEDLHGLII